MHYGIIGYPLSHTFSPAYFRKKFSALHIAAQYNTYPLSEITAFPELLSTHPDIVGLNVTLPYKQAVIPYLHEIDEVVVVTGATNCITIKDGYRKGYNTDVAGFEQSLIPLLRSHHSKALVLGSGGGAKAVCYVLTQLGIPYRIVSRAGAHRSLRYEELNEDIINEYKLIVNTTPVGMYPLVDAAPNIPYQYIGAKHLLYDLTYNPEETMFLMKGKANGATIKNGFEMLLLQADASWSIWNKRS